MRGDVALTELLLRPQGHTGQGDRAIFRAQRKCTAQHYLLLVSDHSFIQCRFLVLHIKLDAGSAISSIAISMPSDQRVTARMRTLYLAKSAKEFPPE